jgi:hypothetical protein
VGFKKADEKGDLRHDVWDVEMKRKSPAIAGLFE